MNKIAYALGQKLASDSFAENLGLISVNNFLAPLLGIGLGFSDPRHPIATGLETAGGTMLGQILGGAAGYGLGKYMDTQSEVTPALIGALLGGVGGGIGTGTLLPKYMQPKRTVLDKEVTEIKKGLKK